VDEKVIVNSEQHAEVFTFVRSLYSVTVKFFTEILECNVKKEWIERVLALKVIQGNSVEEMIQFIHSSLRNGIILCLLIEKIGKWLRLHPLTLLL
jgi:hypothetical protein